MAMALIESLMNSFRKVVNCAAIERGLYNAVEIREKA